MDKFVLKNLINTINKGINDNKQTIEQAIEEELNSGNNVDLQIILNLLETYRKIENFEQKNTIIAVCYNGNPEITITYILDSIIHNNKVTLCATGNKIINEVLITIILESMYCCKIKNEWIDYSADNDENYLKNNQHLFDKIVYVGDYFEYKNFKYFIEKDVEYNNYGYIKLYIDKSKYMNEYKEIMKYTYFQNIYLEVYTDINDFINDSTPLDFSVVYADEPFVTQIKESIKTKHLLINKFPYSSYRFKINTKGDE